MENYIKLFLTNIITFFAFYIIGIVLLSITSIDNYIDIQEIFLSIFVGGLYFAITLFMINIIVFLVFNLLYCLRYTKQYINVLVILETASIILISFLVISDDILTSSSTKIIFFLILIILPIGQYIKFLKIKQILLLSDFKNE